MAAVALLATVASAGLHVAPAGAIVGGGAADAGEWPWQVALLIGGSQACGGSLVAPDLILTAAHCTEDVPTSAFEVVAGTVDLSGRDDGERREVVAVDQHEDYDPVTLQNDIALLELDEPFDLDDDVAIVALATRQESADIAGAGDPGVVTGFGETDGGAPSEVLLEADVDVFGDRACEVAYQRDGQTVFGATQVCAGRDRGHVDACYGDSGGPLVVPSSNSDDEPEDFRQIGIVSWGNGCGVPNRPTVYTEVSAFASWLAERGVEPAGSVLLAGDGARLPARGTAGKAASYPLVIDVKEFEGDLRSVTVELRGLTHSRPADLDMWLVAPDGTVVTLLSDAGGAVGIDQADIVLVDGGERARGSGLASPIGPTDLDDGDDRRRGGRAATGLATLAGVDPVGSWQLLIADDRSGAAGDLDSWNLQLR